jgi:PAS domain S-box-containing protein
MPADDDDDDTRRRTPRPSDAEYDPRRTIDLIPGLFVTVRPDGEVEHANQQLLEFVGQSLEELRAWGTNGTVHADDIERIKAAWTYALTTGTHYDVEQRLRCHDGQYRWVQVRAYPMLNRAGDIVRWHVQILDFDAHKAKLERLRRNELRLSRALTEQTLARKASEDAVAALRATERELTHMIESIPVYALCTDTAGVITYINQRFLQALGATLDQLRTGWPDFIHPDDRDLVLGSWVRAVASGEGYRLAMRIRHPGGHYRWIDAIHQLARDKSGAPGALVRAALRRRRSPPRGGGVERDAGAPGRGREGRHGGRAVGLNRSRGDAAAFRHRRQRLCVQQLAQRGPAEHRQGAPNGRGPSSRTRREPAKRLHGSVTFSGAGRWSGFSSR